MKRIIAALVGVLAVGTAHAQTTRTVGNLALRPELQGELALKNGDYLLLALHGQRDAGSRSYDGDGRFLGLDQRRLTLGYEHFWNDQWSGGGTLYWQTAAGDGKGLLVPELLLRHRSPLGPLTFGQRLGVERRFDLRDYVGGPGPGAQNWLRLRVDLEKLLPLGTLTLRPRLSYEAATHLRLQKEATDADERTIQFTSLRGEVGLRFGPRFDLTPWLAYQTNYLVTLPQYDMNGKQTSGGKLNAVTPAVGLDARLTILQGKAEFERHQLPTQH